MREHGTIKWYSDRKKFGYIVIDGKNEEVFSHCNDCGNLNPKAGIRVEFDLGFDRMSRKKVINIVCVGVPNENNNR